MMILRRISTAVAVVVLGIVSLFGVAWRGSAYAAQTATVGGNALKVSPVRMDLKLDPGASQTVDVFVENLTSIPANLQVDINDFVAADESGKPAILLNANQSAPTHSFRQFVAPVGNITVAPHDQKDVKVTINVPKGAAGGGYFGAIRFAPANPGGNANVNLAASIGTLVLLQVNGDIKEELGVASFDVRKNDKPGTFFTKSQGLTNVVRFHNTGNVQVEPFGTMTLKRFGKTVATYPVNTNDPKGNVLPDSIRRFDTSLGKLSSFGKFTLSGNFGYGSTGQLLTTSITFYVVPVVLILSGLGVLLLILFLIFVLPRMIRSYNRRIIRKATRRR